MFGNSDLAQIEANSNTKPQKSVLKFFKQKSLKPKKGNNGIIPALSIEKTPSKSNEEGEPESSPIQAIDQQHIENLDSAIEQNSEKLSALNTIVKILIKNILTHDIVKF